MQGVRVAQIRRVLGYSFLDAELLLVHDILESVELLQLSDLRLLDLLEQL